MKGQIKYFRVDEQMPVLRGDSEKILDGSGNLGFLYIRRTPKTALSPSLVFY